MDIATYGAGLFTPIILGAIDVSGKGGGVIAHDFADARGSAAIDLFLLLGSSWNLGRSSIRTHPYAGNRSCLHGCWHVVA
jgi:putative MFS transporter